MISSVRSSIDRTRRLKEPKQVPFVAALNPKLKVVHEACPQQLEDLYSCITKERQFRV